MWEALAGGCHVSAAGQSITGWGVRVTFPHVTRMAAEIVRGACHHRDMAERKPRVTDWRLVVQSRLDRVRADLAALGPSDPVDPEGDVWRRTAEEQAAVVDRMLSAREPWWRM